MPRRYGSPPPRKNNEDIEDEDGEDSSSDEDSDGDDYCRGAFVDAEPMFAPLDDHFALFRIVD
jgi:hypothetical protein